MKIPQQLRDEKFIILGQKSKNPQPGISWKRPEEQHDAKWTERYCTNSGANYGVLYSKDTMLCVIDEDNAEAFKDLPFYITTYTVGTGRPNSAGKHVYLRIFNIDEKHDLFGKKLILYKEGYKDPVGDIRMPGFTGYNVGPYCTHPTGNQYTPEDETAKIMEIKVQTLQVLLEVLGITYKVDTDKKPERIRPDKEDTGLNEYGVTVLDFLYPTNPHTRGDEIEGGHPIHGSETGTNLIVKADGSEWWCRRCSTGGGIMKAIAVANGIIDCSDAGRELTKAEVKQCYKILNKMKPDVAKKKRDQWKQKKHEEQQARIKQADSTPAPSPAAAPAAKASAAAAPVTDEETYNSQMGLTSIISQMTDLIMYDSKARQWYVKDTENYCYEPSPDNGYSSVSNRIFRAIEPYTAKTKKFCSKQNISSAIDLARNYLTDTPADVAYVFNRGKTVYIYQDKDFKWHVEERPTPAGLKTTLRVKGEYWKGSLPECPKDFQDWINAYGAPDFILALCCIFARALLCRPDKICFELVSEAGNTGKSTLVNCLCGAWGDKAFTRIEAKEIMQNKNPSGRRTALLQAISKPFTILNEAEGKIDEGTFKEVVDTTPTFSGNYCGRDRVEVTRRSCIFVESNKLIRANNTSAYAHRAYPIEFTREFPNDDTIEDKSKSESWHKYARGIMLTALDIVVENINNGKNIETTIAEISPSLTINRNVLIQEQDYIQSIINSIIERGTDAKQRVTVDGLWLRIADYAKDSSRDITELGIRKDGQGVLNHQARYRLGRILTRMGYDTVRTHTSLQGNDKYVTVIIDAKYIS